jgi:hypothetical protein
VPAVFALVILIAFAFLFSPAAYRGDQAPRATAGT